MKSIWILAFLSITLAFLSFQSAFALSCERPTFEDEFNRVGTVFIGKVIAKEYLSFNENEPYSKYAISTLQVEEILKGSLNDTVTIKSNEGRWGIELIEDWNYLIFGLGADDNIRVGMCTNSGSLPPIPDPEKIGAIQVAEYRMKQLNAFLLGEEPPSFELKKIPQVSSDGVHSKSGIQVPPGKTKEITLHCNPDEYATSAHVKVTSGDLNLMESQLVVHDPEKIRGESWRGKTTLEAGAVNNSNKTGTFSSIVYCKKINSESLAKQISLGVSENKIQCKENLKLIFKATDNSPACVKSETAQKLLERGWTKLGSQFSEKLITKSSNLPESQKFYDAILQAEQIIKSENLDQQIMQNQVFSMTSKMMESRPYLEQLLKDADLFFANKLPSYLMPPSGGAVRTEITEQQAEQLKLIWSEYFVPTGIKNDEVSKGGFTTKYFTTIIETEEKYYLINLFVSYKT